MSENATRRARRDHGELAAKVLDYLRTEPADTSVRAVGAAVGVPAGTAQQVLLRLSNDGRIAKAESAGRATLWRIAA